MRVISGKVRGLKLNAPKNDNVRPTTDRVKESLFNMINEYMIDSNILDLFAGTGSLGIECLSRGANKCIFVDISKDSIDVLRSNIKKCRFEEESLVLNLDFKDAIKRVKLGSEKFDVIFMDPPYYKDMFITALKNIEESNILNEDGIIVVEHDSKDAFPESINRLEKYKEKKYGNTTLTLYRLEA